MPAGYPAWVDRAAMLLRTLPLANRRAHGTANPGADGHAFGLSQRANGLDRLGWETHGDMTFERPRTASARLAPRGLTVRGVVVVLEMSPRRSLRSQRCEMLSPLAVAKREVEDEVGVQGVRDTAEGRQPGLVLPALEPSDRRL